MHDTLSSSLWSSILEDATVAAARSQFQMIKKLTGWSDEELARRVAKSKLSLDLLASGGTPAYDDAVVALLYLLRYHYSHVNMAWTAIAESHPSNVRNALHDSSTDLQVVDFGAGTSAMYVGVVLCVAEALATKSEVSSIVVHSIEPSDAMRAMALAFGSALRTTAVSANRRSRAQATALLDALNHVQHLIHNDWSEIQRSGTNRWLSALHTVYEEPQHSLNLKSAIGRLNWRLSPTEGLVTFHESKRRSAFDISPFKGRERVLDLEPKLSPRRLRELDKVCRTIGFVRYPNNPYGTQVYSTSKDAAALHWADLTPANVLGTRQ